MKRGVRLLVLFLVWTSLAAAQTGTVIRGVNLRSDASTDSNVVEKLSPGTQLQLVGHEKTNGYYHVTAPDGQDGWVVGS